MQCSAPEQRLREWRKATGTSQPKLARAIGFHQCMICAVERGQRTPGLKLAAALERVTGIKAVDWVASLFEVPVTVATVADEPFENPEELVATLEVDAAPVDVDDDLATRLREALG